MSTDVKSNAAFWRWMKPILVALRELGGSGKPQEVRAIIAKNENLSPEELAETRGKNGVNKFENEVAFARNYLVKSGYLENKTYGIWSLTAEGKKVEMTDELASAIFKQGMAEMKDKASHEPDYSWVDFYSEFADILLQYKNDRTTLIEKVKEIFQVTNLKLPKLEDKNNIVDIDPFTIFCFF